VGQGVHEEVDAEEDADGPAQQDHPGHRLVGLELDEQVAEGAEEGRDPGAHEEGVHDGVEIVLALGVADGQDLLLEERVGGQAEEPDAACVWEGELWARYES
jgi:hypothetical protein